MRGKRSTLRSNDRCAIDCSVCRLCMREPVYRTSESGGDSATVIVSSQRRKFEY